MSRVGKHKPNEAQLQKGIHSSSSSQCCYASTQMYTGGKSTCGTLLEEQTTLDIFSFGVLMMLVESAS